MNTQYVFFNFYLKHFFKIKDDQLLKSWERNTVTSAEKLVLQFQQLREALQSVRH